MAQVLKLVSGTTDVMDFLAGNLRVQSDGWETQAVTGEGDPVWDSFTLVGRGTSDTTLADAVSDIGEFIAEARRRANNISRDENHWLHYKPEGGTELRTLITDGSLMVNADPGKGGLGPLMNSDGFVKATLGLQHQPWWESMTPGTIAPGAGVTSSLGGTINMGTAYTGSALPYGDLPGRINTAFVSSLSGLDHLDDLWLGIRPTYNGIANFNPLIECEKGSIPAGAGGTAQANALASNGTSVNIFFNAGGSAMEQRLRIGIHAMATASAADDYMGKYLVLGRLQTGGGGTVLINLYQGLSQVGYSGTPAGIEMVGETQVSNAVFALVELGQVQIPPFGSRVLDGELSYTEDTTLYIFAQSLAGTVTPNLYLDALVLIPCEHMLTVKNSGITSAADSIRLTQGTDGKSICVVNSGSRSEVVEHSVNNFTAPPDSGVMVVAAQEYNEHDLGSTVDPIIVQYPRYSLVKA